MQRIHAIELPEDLFEAAGAIIREGKVRSIDELVERALRREIRSLHRAVVDTDFAEMATDSEYQSEAKQLLYEFARADFETLPPDPPE